MVNLAIYGMIFLGSALMVYNIVCFVGFARYVRALKTWDNKDNILLIPIVLLVLFLIGYVVVGVFGRPDLVVAGILFGGSVFVYIMYRLLDGITRRIQSGEQLAARLAAAEESDRAKTRFLASISHEMRTPMNVILGLGALELKNDALQPRTRACLEKIDRSGRLLLALINNILDINSLGADAVAVKQEPFRLSEALAQVETVVQTLCAEKGLSFTSTLSEEAEGLYCGDETQLKKALMNILDNAVKYTQEGSVRLAVDVQERNGDRWTLRFLVRDTGVGIDSAFIPQLFTPFSQEDSSATSAFGGGGLSLALTKSLLERMGGSLAVESRKNAGAAFTVLLPVQRLDGGEAAEAEKELSLAGRRVLIVEDLPFNAEIVMDLLELEEVDAAHALNGKVAVELFEQSPLWYYDAVLMDLRMPVMDGLEATRRIRALDRPDAKRVPIIALSANAFESDVRQSLEAGMNDHLAKPADSDMLYATLRRYIAETVREG